MAQDVWRGSRPARVRRLRGGLGASTHRVTLERRGTRKDVVLKRFVPNDEAAKLEWDRTVYASTLPVRTPDALAFDEGWFGAPAFVLSCVAGRPELWFTKDTDAHYERIAETMLAIASAPRNRLPAAVRRTRGEWEPPKDLPPSRLADRAIAEIRELIGETFKEERVMTHGDPHPGNMLWSRGQVTLIDWRSCNLEWRTHEVVYCRTELAVLRGLREADRFLEAYEHVAATKLEHVRAWDLLQGLNAMCWVPWWAYAYREQGRGDLTDEIGRRRARAFVRRALERG